MNEVARTRRDDARHEPWAEIPDRAPGADVTDPLAELARLVGQDDPFRGVFRPGADRVRAPEDGRAGALDARYSPRLDDARHPAEVGTLPDVHGREGVHEAHDGYGVYDDHDGLNAEGYDDAGHAVQRADADHAWHDDGHRDHHADDGSQPDAHRDGHYAGHEFDDHRYAAEDYHDEAGLADGHLAAEAAAATLPDMWARQGDAADGSPSPDHLGATRPDAAGSDEGRRSSARRPLAVLAAVLVLTGGGLAASFLVKGPSTSNLAAAGSGRAAPTIMAATSPTKVKVEDAEATAPEDKDAALLNKNGNVSSGPVRIVSSQEQPADLGQLPKSSSDLAEGARPLPPAAPSPFPEPKKVKTFVVHPDGTMLSADGAPLAVKEPGNAEGAGTPSAATPRAASGATTPPATVAAPKAVAPPDALASLAAPPADAGNTPSATPAKPARQPASPGARAASAKPNDAADAPSASGASFGVQLASLPVEADARAAFAKLKKRYPAQLGSLTASVHKAETGDKPIYRVRVGSMSQDEANTLCSQLKGAGGSCFVVHN